MTMPRSITQHLFGLIFALAGLLVTLMPGAARLVSTQAAAPSWSYTGNLISASDAGTMTLLPNGRVLIVGRSAELYDPATGAWNSTGSFNSAGGASHPGCWRSEA